MTSTYSITVDAQGSTDAADIAKRRAREDGYKVRTVNRIHRVGPTTGTRERWAVELAVSKP